MSTTEVDIEQQVPAPEAEAERTNEQRFRYRTWVHYGQGAAACEHGTDGKCADSEHFHAFCRLPNGYQQRDIVEKAQAARARRARMYRDKESDAYVILEGELDVMRDVPKELLVDELMDKDFTEIFTEAVKEVQNVEDPNHVPEGEEPIRKLYDTIGQDREEYNRQLALPEEQRGDDFDELKKTLENYSRDLEIAMDRISQPRRDHLLTREVDDLLALIRVERVDAKCLEAYLFVYGTWQMFVCTYKPHPSGKPVERVWSSVESMKFQEDPEIINAVKEAMEDLEAEQGRARQQGKV